MYKIATAALISLGLCSLPVWAQDDAAASAAKPTAAASATAVPETPAVAATATPHVIAACDGGPHCVSSTSREEGRYAAPIRFNGSAAAAQQAMARIIGTMKGGKVVTQEPGYLHAEFTSGIMRFTDDVEMVIGDNHRIQLRSSSRIGYYDFGVNRDRVEALRKAFGEIQP